MKNTHNNKTNFPVNATKGAQVLALVFVIGAAVFTNGDQTAIAANASVQPHSGILISTPPPPPPTHNLKARKGAYIAGKGHSRANTFADFYKQTQIELFSALDNVLSQKAEDTLSEFAAVKKAEVNFQTSLGHRKGQLGINLIGAFAERQNNAFGWQVRVYGAQQDGKGFNAGVFYRHITDNVLFGANAFVDYENHKLGNFYRYSIGGELQNQYGSFAANYYVPITNEKRKDGGVIFSRKGYDAKLRLNIPNAKFLKAAVDYYNFGDEHGAESDDGFRYGAEAHLIPGLRIALLYDNGEEELGGEVSYIHTIGEVQQSQTANEQWTPDLFAAISREHSQRIISVQAIQLSLMPMVPIQTTLVPSQTITTIITTRTEMVMREANVDFTSSYVAAAFATIVSFGRKILATLPPATASRPYVLTIMRDLNDAYSGVNGGGGRAIWPPSLAGNNFGWLNDVRTWTIIIAEGSEDFTGVMITTATETEMTNRMTTFLTTTIGATDYDNSIPPGFSPSFPPSFPQVPKLALAAPVIPAKTGIQTFFRHSCDPNCHSRLRGNDNWGRQSRPSVIAATTRL